MRHQTQKSYQNNGSFPFHFFFWIIFLFIIFKWALFSSAFWILAIIFIIACCSGSSSQSYYRYSNSRGKIIVSPGKTTENINSGEKKLNQVNHNLNPSFCTNCGHKNDTQDNYCYKCGSNLMKN